MGVRTHCPLVTRFARFMREKQRSVAAAKGAVARARLRRLQREYLLRLPAIGRHRPLHAFAALRSPRAQPRVPPRGRRSAARAPRLADGGACRAPDEVPATIAAAWVGPPLRSIGLLLGRRETQSRQRLEPWRLQFLGQPSALEQASPLVCQRSSAEGPGRAIDRAAADSFAVGEAPGRTGEPLERSLLFLVDLEEPVGRVAPGDFRLRLGQ